MPLSPGTRRFPKAAQDQAKTTLTGSSRKSADGIEKSNAPRSWRQKARDLDRERGTSLGSLGYLPPEVRRQIWKTFFAFVVTPSGKRRPGCEEWNQIRRAADLPFQPRIFWEPEVPDGIFGLRSYSVTVDIDSVASKNLDRSSNVRPARHSMTWYRENHFGYGILKKPLLASQTIRFELETLFLSMHQFSFDRPSTLMKFCRILTDSHRKSLRHLALWIKGPRLWPGQRVDEDHYVAVWRRAVRTIPNSLKAVLICTSGGFDSKEQEQRILGAIAETVEEMAPWTTSCSHLERNLCTMLDLCRPLRPRHGLCGQNPTVCHHLIFLK